VERYIKNKNLDAHIDRPLSDFTTDDTNVLVISDPIVTLIYSEKLFWMCIGEVNNIRIDGNFAASVPIEMLDENTVTISYQMLGLRPATTDDDPKGVRESESRTGTRLVSPGHRPKKKIPTPLQTGFKTDFKKF